MIELILKLNRDNLIDIVVAQGWPTLIWPKSFKMNWQQSWNPAGS